jgi:hypothetical protein
MRVETMVSGGPVMSNRSARARSKSLHLTTLGGLHYFYGTIGHGVNWERAPLDGVTVGEESSDADEYPPARGE